MGKTCQTAKCKMINWWKRRTSSSSGTGINRAANSGCLTRRWWWQTHKSNSSCIFKIFPNLFANSIGSSGSSGPGAVSSSPKQKILTSKVRYAFIVVAFLFLSISAFCFILVSADWSANSNGHSTPTSSVQRLAHFLYQHRSTVIFVSSTFATLQLVAILAAILGWSTILFSYVVITGILGIIVGIVGIVGIIVSIIFLSHRTNINNHGHQQDAASNFSDAAVNHPIGLSIIVLICFMTIFYTLTVLGIKLIEHFRKNIHHKNRRNRLNRSKMNEIRLSSSHDFRSIGSIASGRLPLHQTEDDDDFEEQEEKMHRIDWTDLDKGYNWRDKSSLSMEV